MKAFTVAPFLAMMGVAGVAFTGLTLTAKRASAEAIKIQKMKKGEDVFAYIKRIKGKYDQTLYQQVIGAANDFKEGDLTIGVGAKDDATRKNRPGASGQHEDQGSL